jgi:hypothetical protein
MDGRIDVQGEQDSPMQRTAFPEFPYTPYPIQQAFMAELYSTIEEGKVGLFESPTGRAWLAHPTQWPHT